MTIKNIGLALVVVIAIATGALLFSSNTTVIERIVGASAGPEHTENQVFLANVTNGGTLVATSSTAGTYTLTSAELRKDVSLLSWTVNVNTTLTTMASTSAPFSTLKPGQSFEVIFHNASTTAAATATFAAGTGVDLQESEGGTVIINGLEFGRLTFIKKANTDIAMIVEGMQVGD